MRKEILLDRLEQLGWSRYRLTKEYCRVQGIKPDAACHDRFDNTVKEILENPETSSTRLVELIVKALDGEEYIQWNVRETVMIGRYEVKVE